MYYLEGNPFLHLFMLAYLEPRPHRPSFRKSFNNSEVGEMTGKLSDCPRSISLPQLGLIAVRVLRNEENVTSYFETSVNSLKNVAYLTLVRFLKASTLALAAYDLSNFARHE